MTVRRRPKARGRIIASQSLDQSVTQKNSVLGQIQELWDEAEKSRQRADDLQRWHDTDISPQDMPVMPDKAPADLKKIRETAPTPIARMLVNHPSQQMRVDDIRLADGDEVASAPAWSIWQRNGMDGKQIPLHRAALTHGLAYGLVLPATGRLDGSKTALIRPQAATKGTAFFRDPFDEWCELYLHVSRQDKRDGGFQDIVTFVDDGYLHTAIVEDGDLTKLHYVKSDRHGMGICPVQRYGAFDLDGVATGEIEPVIGLLKRIDQDTNDRLVIQRFAAWVVRTIAGMKEPENEEMRAMMEVWLAVGDFLSSDNPDTKFGSLPPTPMEGHLHARDSDMKDLAFVSQVPAYQMLGLADNIGADAIAAADSASKRKVGELQTIFGEQHEGAMRLAGVAMGDQRVATDFTSRVHWAVIESGSLQSLAQGLASLTAVDVPAEMLWNRIPNWTREDSAQAKRINIKLKAEAEAAAMMQSLLGGTADGKSTDRPGAATPRPAVTAG